MTLTQWDYYDEHGHFRPEAELAERLIRRVLDADPSNALAHHLHIHIAETAHQSRCGYSMLGVATACGCTRSANLQTTPSHSSEGVACALSRFCSLLHEAVDVCSWWWPLLLCHRC